EKSVIDVYVSEGKERVVFEDHVGKMFAQVERILLEKGYQEVRSYDVVSDEPVGQIVKQIQPDADSEVVPEDTVVIFEVSSGPKQTALANLVGLTLEQAKEYADRNNFKLSTKEAYSDSVEKGRISAQEPGPDKELKEGSTITVTISKGSEAKPPRSHSVAFTVPFKPTENEDGELEKKQLVQIYVED